MKHLVHQSDKARWCIGEAKCMTRNSKDTRLVCNCEYKMLQKVEIAERLVNWFLRQVDVGSDFLKPEHSNT